MTRMPQLGSTSKDTMLPVVSLAPFAHSGGGNPPTFLGTKFCAPTTEVGAGAPTYPCFTKGELGEDTSPLQNMDTPLTRENARAHSSAPLHRLESASGGRPKNL